MLRRSNDKFTDAFVLKVINVVFLLSLIFCLAVLYRLDS
jgi:hypothetical protein